MATKEIPFMAPRFKVLHRVTVPTLTLDLGVENVMKFLTPFTQAPARAETILELKPPMVARVESFQVDGQSAGEHSVVGGAVLLSVLDERYPDHGYVGKTFAITKIKRTSTKEKVQAGRKEYFNYMVNEVELI